MVNCGFYEGIQAELALKVLENWSAKAGLCWGGGIGVGGGGGLAMMAGAPPEKGPMVSIHRTLEKMSGRILQGEEMERK